MQLSLFDAPAREEPRRAPLPAPGPPTTHLALWRRLDAHLGGRLRELVLTDNRSRILTTRSAGPTDPDGLRLRLHRCFLGAPDRILGEVALFAGGKARGARRKRALAAIRAHFNAYRSAAPAEVLRPSSLRPMGEVFDLSEVRDDLNRRYFADRLTAAITWGKGGGSTACRRRRARTRTIQLGSYSVEDDLVRIHRALDHPDVPRYVVEAVVYHELLHADLPPVVRGGRRSFHTPEFRRRERLFPLHGRAERWVRDNLPALLARR